MLVCTLPFFTILVLMCHCLLTHQIHLQMKTSVVTVSLLEELNARGALQVTPELNHNPVRHPQCCPTPNARCRAMTTRWLCHFIAVIHCDQMALVISLLSFIAVQVALSGRNEETLAPLLEFLMKNITNPHYSKLLVEVTNQTLGVFLHSANELFNIIVLLFVIVVIH